MITGTQHIRRMRGESQSHLFLCSDGYAYVVKFQNNPQHLRILANEYIVSSLLQAVGLTVPHVAIIDISRDIISTTSQLVILSGDIVQEPCKSGLHFGSRFTGGSLAGQALDYLPADMLKEVANVREFAGMLAMDKWTSNSDGRQAVFHKRLRDDTYIASFIDHGYCFNGGRWNFNASPLSGAYRSSEVYRHVEGWDDFEPWLTRIERLNLQDIWLMIRQMPREWCDDAPNELDSLITTLFSRRPRIRDLITEFKEYRQPFPNWRS